MFVTSTSLRIKDKEQIWPSSCSKISPQISWYNVSSNCDLVDILIIDLGGVGEHEYEGKNFVHLHLQNIPVSETTSINAGNTNKLAEKYGLRNSTNDIYFYPFKPPHPPHTYSIQVTAHNSQKYSRACKEFAEIKYKFYG